MRSLKEIGEVLLANQDLFSVGLCGWIYNAFFHCLISFKEEAMLFKMIEDVPKMHPGPPLPHYNIYCWPPFEIQPRIDWINDNLINAKQ